MCGILSIINAGTKIQSENLLTACSIIRHRGPDDEGLLTWVPGADPVIWAGADTADTTRRHWQYDTLMPGQKFKVGMGHRRLSILDLSPGGHQPMRFAAAGLAITFNGEVYNYIEIKKELETLGHKFDTRSDTEVILHAWQQWGVDCLQRFNGMFAFVLLDYRKNELFAVRDRYGVKPLCYYMADGALYLASEIKQLRTAPGYSLRLNETITRQFLAAGVSDHTPDTFDTQIKYVPQGHYLHLPLNSDALDFSINKWYTLKPVKWQGSYEDAADRLKELLIDAVNVRLRSDVPVGSCLSGGLDSSSIVCIVANLLKERGQTAGQETVTACYEQARYDEWNFAQEVIKKTNSRPHQIFPSFKGLQETMEKNQWHQDEPTGSTSQYSQWEVFRASHEAGLKVMIDGQGADEQLAGYGGNDVAFYSGLLRKMKFAALLDEALAYKKERGHWPIGFLLNAFKLNTGADISVPMADWLSPAEPAVIFPKPATSLRENLERQLYREPLPSLLRYEDRNSMAWSIESRTPFMDYRLPEFTLGLPERFTYKRGTRKEVLRSAMKDILPPAITNRRDKMGFVTPEEVWLKNEGKAWFMDGIQKTCSYFDGTLLNGPATIAHVQEIIDGSKQFNFMPWRVFCLGKWFEMLR
jgi:asparagine synthase (glutamine-hydrolysing)